jgi:hypothetical protein
MWENCFLHRLSGIRGGLNPVFWTILGANSQLSEASKESKSLMELLAFSTRNSRKF